MLSANFCKDEGQRERRWLCCSNAILQHSYGWDHSYSPASLFSLRKEKHSMWDPANQVKLEWYFMLVSFMPKSVLDASWAGREERMKGTERIWFKNIWVELILQYDLITFFGRRRLTLGSYCDHFRVVWEAFWQGGPFANWRHRKNWREVLLRLLYCRSSLFLHFWIRRYPVVVSSVFNDTKVIDRDEAHPNWTWVG